MQDNPLSTLDKADTEIIHKLVAAARAAGLTRFTGSFASQMPMHRVGYSQVKFTWESGRHSIPGSIHIEWDARLQVEEKS